MARKRKAPDLENGNDPELLKALECPVCLEGPMLPPLMQCKNGHVLCGNCRAKSACNVCPTCRVGAIDTRCLALEKLAQEKLKVCCLYKESGCDQVVAYSKAAEHAKDCQFRPIDCPCVTPCAIKVPFKKESILAHFREHHAQTKIHPNVSSQKSFSTKLTIDTTTDSMDSVCEFAGELFIAKVMKKSDMFYAIVQTLARPHTESFNEKFKYRLTVSLVSGIFEWTYAGAPAGPRITPNALVENGLCMAVKLAVLKRHFKDSNECHILLDIWKRGDKAPPLRGM
eukprot:gnl/TRDRNA2_/TRDRNA2_36457_c0_seq1.p1 gnl/TRDRNA2_/TRDRNA2_36457_c0~~gnl/TRDRNA2_/TRDRNA2_36457_c0_seq1.p1  ORF type:complete len:284 (+),score=37.11 gnl/TRDRNA2_/TRDRNA2_36457_c0_seq1:95-946(+)